MIKGVIYGMVYRAKELCTYLPDCEIFLKNSYNRLLARGYQKQFILPVFHKAIKEIIYGTRVRPAKKDTRSDLLFHLDFNPADPSSRNIQKLF